MGLPLPTGTLYQLQHKYWPDEDDASQMSDQERMQKQDNAYQGRFKRPLKRMNPQDPDHNVIDNRCEPIVSTGVDFLLGDGVEFEVVNDDDSADEDAQTYLDAVWDANLKMPTLAEYEINNGCFGHSFLKLIPDDYDMPCDDQGKPYPSFAILNPMQMLVRTEPTDVRKVSSYAFTYEDVDQKSGRVVECRQLTVRTQDGQGWEIHDQVRKSALAPNSIAGALSPVDPQQAAQRADAGWDDVKVTSWTYPWSPIHDGKNLPHPNSYWGKADLRMDILHLNDVLNFLLSNRQRILYYHAHPSDIFFGVRGLGDIDTSPGGAICIPNPNAKVQHIEMAGDLAALANAIEEVRESMDELSHVPSVAVGRLKNLPGVPSGVALKVAYRPLIAQTLQKRALREAVYIRLCQHILELGGYGPDRQVQVHWPEMLPTDELQEAQQAAIWQGIGVSRDTLLQRGGFDPDVEAEKRQEEADEEAEQRATDQANAIKQLQDQQQQAQQPPTADDGQADMSGDGGDMGQMMPQPAAKKPTNKKPVTKRRR